MTREEKITLIGLIIFVGFFASVCYHYVQGVYLHRDYPYNTFLFRPWDRFMDFFNNYNGLNHRPTIFYKGAEEYIQKEVTLGYWSLFTFIFSLFSMVKPPALAYLSFAGVAFIAFLTICAKNLWRPGRSESLQGILIFSCLSYPVLMVFDRGNIEIYLFIFLYLFLHYYGQGRYSRGTFFLALATLIKPMPVFFLVFLIACRRYRQLLYFVGWYVVLCLALSAVMASFFHTSLFSRTAVEVLLSYTDRYAIGNEGLVFGSSLFGFLKIAGHYLLAREQGAIAAGELLVRPYTYCAVGVSLLAAIYVLCFEKERWRQVAVISCAMILLPFVSGAYRLLHIFLPLFLFVNHAQPHEDDRLYCVLFGLLLIPKDYFHFSGIEIELSLDSVANPLAMLIMVGMIVVSGRRQMTWYNLKQAVVSYLPFIAKAHHSV